MSEKEFTAAVHAHSPRLLRYIRSRTRCQDDARDVMQITWLYAWRKRDSFDEERSALLGWLHLIARSAAAGYYKNAYRQRVWPFLLDDDGAHYIPVPDGEPDPDRVLDRKIKLELIEQALERVAVPDLKKYALRLYYFGGWSYREIAAILNISEAQVHPFIREARWSVYADVRRV